jgi:hypothetical protein
MLRAIGFYPNRVLSSHTHLASSKAVSAPVKLFKGTVQRKLRGVECYINKKVFFSH